MQFFLYPVTFFGNPILAMVNGVLLLSVVSLPRAVERGEAARRREIVGRGGEKRGGRGGGESGKENGREAESFGTTVFHGVANSYRP